MTRVLFLGDVVGRAARHEVINQVPLLRARYNLDFVVVNCENAAGGFGVTPAICEALFDAGVDVLTTGNHVWDKPEIIPYIEAESRLLRPLNMPEATPGNGVITQTNSAGKRLTVINIMTNLFMAANDPVFAALDGALTRCKLQRDTDFILVDAHGEATSEKMALGHMADGRASLLVGTHTHVPTADHRILMGGTAYQTDAGMCGDYDSVIGMDKVAATARFTGRGNNRLSVATGAVTLCGLLVEADTTGLAKALSPLRAGGGLSSC